MAEEDLLSAFADPTGTPPGPIAAPTLDLSQLASLGPPPQMPQAPTPPVHQGNVVDDPRQKLTAIAALAAAIAGGPRSGLANLGHGVLQGQLASQNRRDEQFKLDSLAFQQQQHAFDAEQQRVQAEQNKRQQLTMSVLNDVRAKVPTFKTKDQYDQYINMAGNALQSLAGSRLSPSALRQQFPFVAPTQQSKAKDAIATWLKVNADAVKGDPLLVGRAFMDIDLNGDGLPERVPVAQVAKAAGVEFAADEKGNLIAGETGTGKLGTPFQESYKTLADNFRNDNHRDPNPPEKKAMLERAILMSKERPEPSGSELSPEGVDFAATQYRVTGVMPALGMGNSSARAAIVNAAAQQAKGLSQTPAMAIQKQAAFKADSTALTKMRGMSSSAESFESKALAQADIISNLNTKVSRTQWPIINDALLSGKAKIAGDANTQLLFNALTTFTAEYAKIMEGSTGSAAGSSDSARRAAERLINASLNPRTLQKTLDLMKREMALTVQGYDATIDHITQRMGGSPPAPTPDTGTGTVETWTRDAAGKLVRTK